MGTPSPVRVSLFAVVAFTLVILGLARAALLVSHDPALGYGDPSPWHRVAGCVGVAPIPVTLDAQGRPRPAAGYHTAGLGAGGCYPSSAAVLAAPVVLVVGIASIASDEPEILVPLQAFGIFTLVLTALLALAVTLALRPHPGANIAHAIVFFVVIADPATTLWFNTLHAEPAAILGAYATVAACTVIALRQDDCPRFWWILGVGLAMLGLAREQFGMLPLLLALIAAPVLLRRSRRRASGILAVAVVTAVLQFALDTPGEQGDRDRADAHAGLLASVSSNPAATLAILGLPARCADVSPSSWLAKPSPPSGECPEADGVALGPLAELAVAEPQTLLRAVSRVLVSAQAMIPGALAIATDGPIASVQDLPPRALSFLALAAHTSAVAMAAVVVGLLVAFPAAVVWLAWSAAREPGQSATPLAFTILVAIGGYTLVTTTFGSGLLSAQRHDWLGEVALLSATLLLPWVLWQLTTELLRARIAMAVLLGVFLLAAGWALWSQRQPLALGAIERTSATGTSLEVTGWALDPWEVRRVYATVGGGPQADAARGTARPVVAAQFPGYPDADKPGFDIAIPSNVWREGQVLRVYVENRNGAVTEIDRRIATPR